MLDAVQCLCAPPLALPTQISTVMQAIKEGKKRFVFQGQEIRLIPSCGIFVTMNPGYAGEPPLRRPCSHPWVVTSEGSSAARVC